MRIAAPELKVGHQGDFIALITQGHVEQAFSLGVMPRDARLKEDRGQGFQFAEILALVFKSAPVEVLGKRLPQSILELELHEMRRGEFFGPFDRPQIAGGTCCSLRLHIITGGQ